MRALISGIVGAAVSSVAWLAIEHFQQQSYSWLVCLVGLVTGLAVHSGAKGPGGGILRGALAVILTLAGIVGGQKAFAAYLQSKSVADQAAVKETIKADTPAKEEESEDAKGAETVAPETEPLELPEQRVPVGNGDYSKSALKKNMSDMEMIWMCVASLLAYVTGKGGEKSPAAAAEKSEGSSDDQPQEDGGE